MPGLARFFDLESKTQSGLVGLRHRRHHTRYDDVAPLQHRRELVAFEHRRTPSGQSETGQTTPQRYQQPAPRGRTGSWNRPPQCAYGNDQQAGIDLPPEQGGLLQLHRAAAHKTEQGLHHPPGAALPRGGQVVHGAMLPPMPTAKMPANPAMQALRSTLSPHRRLVWLLWLLWLVLLLPLAQTAANLHLLSHATAELAGESGGADGKLAIYPAHCDRCLMSAALIGAAPPVPLAVLAPSTAPHTPPDTGFASVWLAPTLPAYQSRAPPSSLL